MRPKSMATVVVTLSGVRARSSTPIEADVIGASVVTGVISEIERTKVVLPTAKPPETTIFTAVGTGPTASASEGSNAIEDPLEERDVRTTVLVGVLVDHDVAGAGEVGDQDARDAE